ncbi:MAG TPA: SCO family protein [Beijerinckiaceae bacterium]|nr:SCO family protein [Beijerinckiaceae bacterium]
MSTPNTALRLIRWVSWSLIGLLGAVTLYILLQPEQQRVSLGGPFTLTTMEGERRNVGTHEKGRPYAVFFGFTYCPDICPTTMFELSQTLKAAGDAVKDFRVYFVSVDPERDTPEQLKLYLSAFDSHIVGLTGTPEEIAAVARQHRAFYRKVPTPSSYTMDHTATIFLFDRKGSFFGTLDVNEPESARLAKLQRLMRS